MPEILESHSTGILAGTRSVTRLDVQPISSRSTRPVSAHGAPWDTGVTILGQRQHGEIIIEANSATIVGSGIALAAVGAFVNSFMWMSSQSPVRALSPHWYLANFAHPGQHLSDLPQPLRADFQAPQLQEGLTSLYSVVAMPSHGSKTMFTHLPFGDWTVLDTSSFEDDDLEFGVLRQSESSMGPRVSRGQDTGVSQMYVVYSSAESGDPNLVQTFDRLVVEWRAGRGDVYSGMEVFMHPAYQKIIGLGMGAVRLILQDLERDLDHWFWALAAITREDPVPAEFKGNMLAMREYWIGWGRRQGYRW